MIEILGNLGNRGKFEDQGSPGQVEVQGNLGTLGSLEIGTLEIFAIENLEILEILVTEIPETLESQDQAEDQENLHVNVVTTETNLGTTSLHSITEALKDRDPDQEIVIGDHHNHDPIIAQDRGNLCLDLDPENQQDRVQENRQDKDRADLDPEK